VRGIDLKIDDNWGLDLFMTGQRVHAKSCWQWAGNDTEVGIGVRANLV